MSIINLINLQFGIKITQEEWDAGKLSKERCTQLGIRSPKLSKALIALGMPSERVAMLISGKSTKSGGVTQVWGEDYDNTALYDQGNSIHYSSCQATDGRAKWFADNDGDDYCQIAGDVKFWGESLFIWAIGQPMSVDGEGFKARAKLRVCYDKDNKEVAGLYIDRPYGQYNLLLDNISQLNHWWGTYSKERGYPITPLLMAPLWQRDNGGGSDFQSEYGGRYERLLWVPSWSSGYQDTLSGGHGGLYDFFIDVSSNTPLTVRAYKAREKVNGVRHHYIKEVMYNPQKGLTKLHAGVPTPRVINRQAITAWQEIWGRLSSELHHTHYGVTCCNCSAFLIKDELRYSKVGVGTFYVVRKVEDYDGDYTLRTVTCSIEKEGYASGWMLWPKRVLSMINAGFKACDGQVNFDDSLSEEYDGDVITFKLRARRGNMTLSLDGRDVLRRATFDYSDADRDIEYECNYLEVLDSVFELDIARAIELPVRKINGVLTVCRNIIPDGYQKAVSLEDKEDSVFIPF